MALLLFHYITISVATRPKWTDFQELPFLLEFSFTPFIIQNRSMPWWIPCTIFLWICNIESIWSEFGFIPHTMLDNTYVAY